MSPVVNLLSQSVMGIHGSSSELGNMQRQQFRRQPQRRNRRRHRYLDDFAWSVPSPTIPAWFDRTPVPAPIADFPAPVISPVIVPASRPISMTAAPTTMTDDLTEVPTQDESDSMTDPPTESTTSTETQSKAQSTFTPSSAPTASSTVYTDDSATALPTETPPESSLQNITKTNGGQETKCSYVPSTGVTVTEQLDLEYFLYLDDNVGGSTSVQAIVDALQIKLHNGLGEIAFGCSDIGNSNSSSNGNINHFHIVQLSNDGPGSDSVGASCPLEAGPSAATSCHQVLTRMTVALWFSGNRRRRTMEMVRELQFPFGGNDAFFQFVNWLEVAFDELPDDTEGILETDFKGFVNLHGIDGMVLTNPQDLSGLTTTELVGSKSITKEGVPFSYGHAAIVLAVIVMMTMIILVLGRRWRNQRAIKERLEQMDDLHFDTVQPLDKNPTVVDDASLFQEVNPLPEEFEVQLEDITHDYRSCASPACRACLRRKEPMFVLTDLKDFERNVARRP